MASTTTRMPSRLIRPKPRTPMAMAPVTTPTAMTTVMVTATKTNLPLAVIHWIQPVCRWTAMAMVSLMPPIRTMITTVCWTKTMPSRPIRTNGRIRMVTVPVITPIPTTTATAIPTTMKSWRAAIHWIQPVFRPTTTVTVSRMRLIRMTITTVLTMKTMTSRLIRPKPPTLTVMA